MKILILTPGILPDTHSGIPKIAYYLARELQRRGNQIIILTRKYKTQDSEYEVIEGMQYYRISYPDRWGPLNILWPLITPWQSWKWQKKIKGLHKDIDVVWVLNPWWTLLLNPTRLWPHATFICQFYCNPYDEITANNGRTLTARLFGYLYNYVMKRCMKQSHYVSVLSEFALEDAVAMLGRKSREKIVVIPGGVDIHCYKWAHEDEKQSLKKVLSLSNNTLIFITARGLKARTGVDKLLSAASLLKENSFSFFLVIIGKGPMKAHIERQINELGLSNQVRLLSDLSEEQLVAYYRASDVFVLPTQAGEAFGLATVEAIATGLVALGTNNGGTPEILKRYNTDWLIPGCDAESIYRKMAEYCSSPDQFVIPKQKMEQITYENFSWSKVAEKFLNICEHNV